jgi:hypothetical protein
MGFLTPKRNAWNIFVIAYLRRTRVLYVTEGRVRICNSKVNVRFEVFTAVTMKNGVFWDVMPCGSCKNRRFGGTWRLLHQGDKNR